MGTSKITQNQYLFIIFSCMIAVGILSMASEICKTANQNAWIAILVGGLYPLFILITAAVIDDKTNHASFEKINKKLYGKILYKIFSLVYFFYFLTIFVSIISGYASVLKSTITNFLHPAFIIIPSLILITIISLSGLYMVGRICELYFYITLPLLIVTLCLVSKGSFTNIKPIIFSFDIVKAIPNTFLAFSGCEIGYFIISKISNNKNTKKTGIIAALLLILIYLINVFMVVYNLGWELTSNLKYPLLYLIQSIEIPILSNFLSIVIFLWSAIILKCLLTYSYTSSSILSNLFKIDYKIANFLVMLLASIYVYFMIPEYNRIQITDKLIPCFIVFSFVWGLITTILVTVNYRSDRI